MPDVCGLESTVSDRFQWRAVLNMVKNLRFHKVMGIS
jgi:hypothetical protein